MRGADRAALAGPPEPLGCAAADGAQRLLRVGLALRYGALGLLLDSDLGAHLPLLEMKIAARGVQCALLFGTHGRRVLEERCLVDEDGEGATVEHGLDSGGVLAAVGGRGELTDGLAQLRDACLGVADLLVEVCLAFLRGREPRASVQPRDD